MQKLHIIDTLGVFVEDDDSKTINWSKVKFSLLETNDRLSQSVRDRVYKRFEEYIGQVITLGYDSISIDDLAHMVNSPIYNPVLQKLIGDYQTLYKSLFELAKQKGLKIFVNTDYLFYNPDIRAFIKKTKVKRITFFQGILESAMVEFPEIDGIILRVGETDGTDVDDRFLSKITVRTDTQANRLLKKILPIFEHHDRILIFRTWTVGAYQIGDLIWNEKTFDRVFASLQSDALVISMKFGDTDFMRFLDLNPLFFKGNHKKIVELQTRREWEGMGNYPSFIGWDYQDYFNRLADEQNIVGIHVWCQTGGWAKNTWSNVTYLDGSSLWNELNTYVTIRMYRHGDSVKTAVESFCAENDIQSSKQFIELLELSEIVIKKGLYIRDLASQKLYFRRTRVPTLMWLTWDKVFLTPTVIYLLRALMPKGATPIKDSDEALAAGRKMLIIGKDLGLKSELMSSLEFLVDSLRVFALLRRYVYTHLSPKDIKIFNQVIRQYQKDYPQHYTVPKLIHLNKKRKLPKAILHIFLRQTTLYRKRDKFMLATSTVQRKLITRHLRKSKSHITDQAMGVDVLLR